MSPFRSISYIATGRPKNRQDCIDYAFGRNVEVSVVLHCADRAQSDSFIYIELYATYIWVFNDTAIAYDESYGVCYLHEDNQRQKTSVDNANRRLEQAIESINNRVSTVVKNKDGKFEYSAILKR